MQATAPPDVANLLTRGDVEAALIWEPTTTQLTQSGAATIIASQQQLWEQTFGGTATEVHVAFLAQPEIARQYPALLTGLYRRAGAGGRASGSGKTRRPWRR